MTSPAPITTTESTFGWRPDAVAFAATDAIPEALLLDAATVLGQIEGDAPVIHVPYVRDAWTAGVVAEGDAIDVSNPGLAEITLTTQKLARLVALSREQWMQPQTSGQIAQSVGRDLVSALDHAFVTGLVGHAGVVAAASEVTTDLDPVIDLIATLETNGANTDNLVTVVAPDVWAFLRKMKVATGWNANLLGAGVNDTQPRLLGTRVRRSRFIPAGSGLVIDAAAIAAAFGSVFVAQSDQYLFNSDSIALRATVRYAFKPVVRSNPDGSEALRVGSFTIESAGS